MSLIEKQQMTEKNLASNRSNAHKSRGAVTSAGKANSAAARLLHGFYSRSRDEAMLALGEDPQEYRRLLTSLVEDLRPNAGLEAQLVLRIGRALWRMQRAERMQDGVAARHVHSGSQSEQMRIASRYLPQQGLYTRLIALGTALQRPDYVPSPEEVADFEAGFGDAPPAEIQKLFPLLESFRDAALKAPATAIEDGGTEPTPPTAEAQNREAARKELDRALQPVIFRNRMVLDQIMKENDSLHSPENLAALMAPRDKKSVLMQRMEDSNLRQLWRLTKLFLMVKRSEGTDVDEGTDAEEDQV
jgi:hypothetical protein